MGGSLRLDGERLPFIKDRIGWLVAVAVVLAGGVAPALAALAAPVRAGEAAAGEPAADEAAATEAPPASPDDIALPPRLRVGPTLFPTPDYSGDIGTRGTLTGDWDGLRTELAEHGVQVEVEVLQVL